MKRYWLGLAALSVMSACGGGVFTAEEDPDDGGGGGDGGSNEITVPETIGREIESIAFDPDAGTLVVTGVGLDDTPLDVTYIRKPGLDQGGYLAFTAQDNPLSRHYTTFVLERDGVYAGVTGSGQFTTLIAGATYGRNGSYTAPVITPDTGVVAYAGNYVGVLNFPGDQSDLLPVAPGTPDNLRPVQIAQVTGLVFINADFADNEVEGTIYNRVATVHNGDVFTNPTNTRDVSLGDVILQRTTLEENGSFTGDVGFAAEDNIGDYGGVFGGTGATAVAGGVFMENHVRTTDGSSETLADAEEYGAFVLPSCNSADAAAICP